MVTQMRALVALLVVAAGLVVAGVALWSVAWALITAGVLVGGLAVVFLVEVPGPEAAAPPGQTGPAEL